MSPLLCHGRELHLEFPRLLHSSRLPLAGSCLGCPGSAPSNGIEPTIKRPTFYETVKIRNKKRIVFISLFASLSLGNTMVFDLLSCNYLPLDCVITSFHVLGEK